MSNTVIGIAIMLVSTSMMNLGAVLQKKAVDQLPSFDGRPLLQSIRGVLGAPLWLIGWLMTTSAMVLNMVALGYADISVIQPLNGFGLVVLALFSWKLLGEKITKLTLVGIAAVVVGVALIGATVPESRAFANADEILSSYTHLGAIVAISTIVVVILVFWTLAKRIQSIAGILYAFVGASCSVTGLTFSKGLFGLFNVAGFGASLALWPTYVLAVVMLGFSTLALMLQTMSFQKGRAVVVTPVFAATSVVLPLAMGLAVFGESVAWLTLVAVLFIVVGVIFLGMKEGTSGGEGDDTPPNLENGNEAHEK